MQQRSEIFDAGVRSSVSAAIEHNASPQRCLPPAVWSDFARDVWEQVPTSMPQPMKHSLVEADDLIQALRSGADAFRVGDPLAMFTFWVDRVKQDDLQPFLPRSDDHSLQGYLDRLHALVAGAEFTVLFANPHLFSDLIARRTRVFLQGLFDVTGMPCGGYDSGIFLGRYSVTPFGVHRGQMSVMTFPVLGRKRFLLWPKGYGEAHADIRDAVTFPDHLATAIEESVVAGDVLYWPADYWHVADDAASFSAALNVGFWWDRPPLTQALLRMSEVLAAEVADDPASDALRNDDGSRAICLHPEPAETVPAQLPRELGKALDIVHRATRGPAVQSNLEEGWLAFQSGGGVRDIRPLGEPGTPFGLEEGMRLRACSPGVVRVAHAASGELIFAANGHAIRLEGGAVLERSLAGLATGQMVAYSERETVEPGQRLELRRAFDLATRARALLQC